MHSSLLIILTSIFGGTLFVAPPPAVHFAYVTFLEENSTDLVNWMEMRIDRIEGLRVYKYKLEKYSLENPVLTFKFKYAYGNFTTETDWVTRYMQRNQGNFSTESNMIDLITMWFCILSTCALLLYTCIYFIKKLTNKY